MSEVVYETALSSSVLFKSFNNNAELTTIITSAIKDSVTITPQHIDEQLLQIRRTNISPLVDQVLEAYENGDIIILYSNIKKVPQALPFFATKINGKLKVFVFVNNYGTLSKAKNGASEQYLNISMKDLYVLMEGALTAFRNAAHPEKITRSLGLMKLSTQIYTNMILRILNKEYAISMDQELYPNIAFCVGKFFLKKVWGYTSDSIIFNYAKSTINTVISSTELLVVDKMYDDANIESIDELIKFIASLSPRMKLLNFRYFTQCFINTYKASAMFGLECSPYFLFTIQASMLGSFVVNQPIISDITKNIKGMNQFYPELVKLLS